VDVAAHGRGAAFSEHLGIQQPRQFGVVEVRHVGYPAAEDDYIEIDQIDDPAQRAGEPFDMADRRAAGPEIAAGGAFRERRGVGAQAEDYARMHGRRVEEVMTPEVVAAEEETSVAEVVDLMERHRIKRMPALREGRLIGIVSRADLLRQLLARLDEDATTGPISDEEVERRLTAALAAEGWAPRIGLRISVEDGIVRLDGVIYDERERQGLRVAAETIPGCGV
jgi:CBS domain-containing protein